MPRRRCRRSIRLMNAPAPASLLVRRRTCAARSHPRRHRGVQRRHQSEQGEPRRRRLLRRERQGAAARMREARRARDRRQGGAAQLPADRRHRRRTTAKCRRCCSVPTATIVARGRAVTVQALGGTGGLKVGADFLRRFAPGAQIWISDPSWENHRALFEGAGFTVNTYAYYDAATRGLDFAGMLAALERIPAGCDRRAARVLPQPDRRRSDAGAMGAHHRGRPRARAGAVSRHRLPGIRRRPRCRRRSRAPIRGDAGTAVRVELVLQVVLALRRARRRADGRRRRQGRSRARAVASEARHARQLLESADARRRRSSRTCSLAGAARAVGSGARDDARSDQADARARWSRSCTSGCPAPISATCSRQRGMFSYSGLTKAQVHRAARGVFDLCDRHRPHLRGGAQLAQRRVRRRTRSPR